MKRVIITVNNEEHAQRVCAVLAAAEEDDALDFAFGTEIVDVKDEPSPEPVRPPRAERVAYTLIYNRKAYKVRDGHDGYLYRLAWATGFDELIFRSPDDASRWADLETRQGRPTEVSGLPWKVRS